MRKGLNRTKQDEMKSPLHVPSATSHFIYIFHFFRFVSSVGFGFFFCIFFSGILYIACNFLSSFISSPGGEYLHFEMHPGFCNIFNNFIKIEIYFLEFSESS